VYGGVRRFTLSQVGGIQPLLAARRQSSYSTNEQQNVNASNSNPNSDSIIIPTATKSGSVDSNLSSTHRNRRKKLKTSYSLPNNRQSNLHSQSNFAGSGAIYSSQNIDEESDEQDIDFHP